MDDIERFCEITGSSEDVAIAKLSENNYSLRSALNAFMTNSSSPNPSSPESSLSQSNSSPSFVTHSSSSSLSGFSPAQSRQNEATTASGSFFQSSRLFTRASSNVDRRSFGGASSTTASNSSSGAVSIPPSSGNNDPRSTMTSSASSSSLTSRRERLLDSIFRPPYDIMFPGDFFSAKDYARDSDVWLLVDIQSSQNFDCQCLNRDIWNNAKVKKLIDRHFLFIQYNVESSEGRRYTQFYPASHFPYVAIIDPRTGELLETYQKLTADGAIKLFSDFINERGSPSISDEVSADKLPNACVDMDNEVTVSPSKGTSTDRSSAFMSMQPVLNEEEALKAAIKASLQHSDKNHDMTSSFSSSSSKTAGLHEQLNSSDSNSHHNPVILSDDEDDDDIDLGDCFEVTRYDVKGVNQKTTGQDEDDNDDTSSAASSILSEDSDSGLFFSPSKNRKRKLKRGGENKKQKKSGGHLTGTLKRLKLDKMAASSAATAEQTNLGRKCTLSTLLGHSNHSSSSSNEENADQRCNKSSSPSKLKTSSSRTLEVQNIGPLVPPPDCPPESFPNEVSLLKDSSLTKQFAHSGVTTTNKIGTNSVSSSCSKGIGDMAGENSLKILLKCPNGERRTINIAASASLKLFFCGCGSLGYSDVLYEFSTHFPKRVLNCLDRATSLSALGITANCIIFVESKL